MENYMKSTMSLVVLLSLAVVLAFGADKKYGKKITLKDKTKISDIMANPESYDGKRVLVEGPIVDVCKERGCWIKIGSDKEFGALRFKVEDGVITFPLEVKGKNALAEGIVSVKKYSVEQLIAQGKETAKEEGKEFDPSTVKGPKTVLQINGQGAVVK